jgi:hypothetical protein
MNPEAFHAMDEPNEKAVFVHVSAGDAGRGVGGEPTPYYLAREEGALRAIRFMANAANATAALGADTPSHSTQAVFCEPPLRGHPPCGIGCPRSSFDLFSGRWAAS